MTNFSLSSALKGAAAAALAVALSGCGCGSKESPADGGQSSGPAAESADTNSVPYIHSQAQKALLAKDWPAAVRGYCRLAYDESLPPEVRSVGWAGKGLVDFARLDEPDAPSERCDFSRTAFMHAIRLDRRNPTALYYLARLYMDQYGFAQEALDLLEMYVAIMKGTDDPHVEKAKIWCGKLKSEIGARKSELPGADRRNLSACADALKRGDALYSQNFLTKAREAYEAALKADPLCYDAAVRLAQCWENTDRSANGRARALKAYRHAVSLRLYPKPLIAAASLAEKLDRRPVALALYSKAVAASPTNTEAIDGLVRVLEKNGQRSVATAYRRYKNAIPAKK